MKQVRVYISLTLFNYMATIKCLNTRAKMSIFLGHTSLLATTLANFIVMCRYVCAVEVRVPVSPVFHSEKSGHPIYKTHQYSTLADLFYCPTHRGFVQQAHVRFLQ